MQQVTYATLCRIRVADNFSVADGKQCYLLVGPATNMEALFTAKYMGDGDAELNFSFSGPE